MAGFGASVIIFLVVFASISPSLEARKLLNTENIKINNNNEGKKVSSSFESLVLSALPKGKVPASSPSKKTHDMLDNEKLFARHLSGAIDRNLQSVPSPAIGH